jgi:hypothetical protein
VSPSKKANKTAASEGLRAAQGKSAQRSARHNSGLSSRVSAKEPEETILTEIVQPKTYNKPGSSRFLTNILRVLALFAVVGITLFFYSIRDRIDELQQWGYPGVFLIALLANATVLLPAPGVAVIYAMGAIFSNPFGVGLAAGLGGTVGELSGYLAGFSGQAVVDRMDPSSFCNSQPLLRYRWDRSRYRQDAFANLHHLFRHRSINQDDNFCPGRALLRFLPFHLLRIRRAQ